MRNNLITVLHCSECGNPLELNYEPDCKPDVHVSSLQPSVPTGAAMLLNRISVDPCKSCMQKHTGPAKILAHAIKQLIGDNTNE